MRWSVGIEAQGDRVLTTSDVVELADAAAPIVSTEAISEADEEPAGLGEPGPDGHGEPR